ncbi:MAG: hypothetical protein PVF70_03255 [Anaerolineales bacterium]|jgi:hypothetical protein
MSDPTEATPRRPGILNAVLAGLAVIWGGIVVVAYYLVHKPIGPAQGLALARLALILTGWIGTLVLAHLMGRIAFPSLQRLASRKRLSLRIGLGLGILGLVMLILGAIRAYWPAVAWSVIGLALPLGLRAFYLDLREALPSVSGGLGNKALAFFVLATLALAFLSALTPPTAFDSLVYHLTGPKLYTQAHRLHHDVDLAHLGFPHWGAMQFTWGMLLAGPQLAQLFHFTFALLTLALVPGIVNRVAPGRGWLAAALMMVVPSAALLSSWAYVEWMTMFAGLAAFRILCDQQMFALPSGAAPVAAAKASAADKRGLLGWLDRLRSGTSRMRPADRRAALVGVFAGLAFAAKYTTLGLVLGLALAVILSDRSLRSLLIFGGAALVVIAPYLLKNLLLTGNPVYPFLLTGKFWDAARMSWQSRPGTGLNALQLLMAPWDATIWGLEGGVVGDHPPYSATVGPLLLMLLPLLVIGWRRRSQDERRLLRLMMVVCLVAYAGWLISLAYSGLLVQTRLLLPILPLLAILAAVGFDGLRGIRVWKIRPGIVLGGMISLVLVLTLVGSALAFAGKSPLPAILGFMPEEEYLTSRLGVYAWAMQEINQLEEGASVVLLWEARSYYCAEHVRCEPDVFLERWWHLRQQGLDAASIAARWREQGVTHVLIYWAGADAVRQEGFDPLTPVDWLELNRLEQDHLSVLVAWEGSYGLYALR